MKQHEPLADSPAQTQQKTIPKTQRAVRRARKTIRRRGGMLLTLQQAEEESGVPYASLRELVVKGHLARVTLGDSARIWIRRADLERLIANSTESVA